MPVVKTLPVTVAMLEAIVDGAECSGARTDLCLARVSVIGYATSLRFNELVHISSLRTLQLKRLHVNSDPQSKTDQLRKGNKVVISWTGSKLCLVSIIEKYMGLFSVIYISPHH